MGSEVVEIVIRERGARGAATSIRRVGGTSRTAAASVRLLTGALAALAGVLGARELIQLSDSFTTLTNRVSIATERTGNLVGVSNELFEISNRTRTSVEANAQLFGRLSLAAGELGASERELLGFTEQVGQLLAIQGGSAESASGAILQLSQAIGSGIVRAEEFNSILEGAAPIANAAARGLAAAGGSVSRLRTLIADGQVTSQQFFQAIRSQADETERVFAETAPTIGQAFSVLRNELIRTVGAINEVTNAGPGLATTLLEIANGLGQNLVQGAAAFVEAGAEVVGVVAGILDSLSLLGPIFPALSTSFQSLGNQIRLIFSFVLTAINSVRVGFTGLVSSFAIVGQRLGLISAETAAGLTAPFDNALADLNDSSLAFGDALADQFNLLREGSFTSLGPAAEQAENLATRLGDAGAALRQLGEQGFATGDISDERPGGAGAGAGATEVSEAQERSLERLLRLQARRNQANLELVDPLLGQLSALDEQRRKVEELDVAAQNEELRQRVISGILSDQARIRQEIAENEQNAATARANFEASLPELRFLDREAADQISRDLATALQDAVGSEETLRAYQEAGEATADAIRQNLGPTLGEELEGAVVSNFGATLRGEGENFGRVIQDTLQERAFRGLEDAFARSIDGFSDLLDNALSSAGEAFGGLFGGAGGGALGSALGAAANLGLSLGLSALQGGDSSSTNNLVRSDAVQNAQAARGVVVGDRNLSVREVTRDFSIALQPTESLLGQILEAILATAGEAPPTTPGGGTASAPLG